MITLDNEKDNYIKKQFKKDELISKKADDVFNNFFKGEINLEQEKVTNINDAKDKKFKRKNILGIIATLVVVFLGANVYAATQGYNNIFFMIKDLSTSKTISGKDEILKDQDITISYEPIEIAKGITVQFNRFIIKDNKATLLMRVNQEWGVDSDKIISQVEVINGQNDSEIATTSLLDEQPGSYTKKIEIGFFNNNVKTLKVNINAKKENLARIKIDLSNREITILNNSYKEIEKISEVELKKALGEYATLNFYNDTEDNINEVYGKNATKEQCVNYDLVNSAIRYINAKEVEESNGEVETIYYTAEKVNKAIKEMTGIEVKDHIDMVDAFCYYNKDLKQYEFEAGDGALIALCLNITNISYEDGIYSVDYQYCYPTEGDIIENTINRLPAYESSLQFKLNENYGYTKYSIVSDIYNLKSKIISNGKENYM